MSAQVTEAHKRLAATIVERAFRFAEGNYKITPLSQLIADSEATATAELRAEVELWEAKCHELIAPHYIIDPCLRAAKFREALAFHPVIRKPKKEDAK